MFTHDKRFINDKRCRRRAATIGLSILLAAMATDSTAFGGDLKTAQRSVRSARTALEQRRYEEVERRLVDAEAQLQGVEEDAVAGLREEIDQLIFAIERVQEIFRG